MNKFIKRNKLGLFLIVLGVLSLYIGIHREEHLTISKKFNIICLECIGIG